MKRITFCMVILSAMALVGTAWAGKDKEESQLRLELDLVDGSHVIGVPSIESVPVQTSYAKMDIALKQILTIKIAEDHETASIALRNGDQLKGVISLDPIKLETVFGKALVPITQVTTVRVSPKGMLCKWEFEGTDLDTFTQEPPGTFSEAAGRAFPSSYGSGNDWYGPTADFPLTVKGDFRLDKTINYRTAGSEIGQITVGVVLENGTTLRFAICDSHTDMIEHAMSFAHGTNTLWAPGIKVSNETFSDYPVAIERSGDLLRCLVADRLVATCQSCDKSNVKKVFFKIDRYETYPVLSEASIGRLSVLQLAD